MVSKKHALLLMTLLLTIFLAVSLISWFSLPTYDETPDFVFAHITDSHCDTGSRTVNTNQSVLWIRQQEEIDFVIHTGDLTQHGNIQAEWNEIHQIMHQLDGTQQWTVLAGNHDNLTYFTETFGDVRNHSVTIEDFAFITMSWISPGEITDAQFNWLEDQLTIHSNYKIVIAHHWLLSNPNEGHHYEPSQSMESLWDHVENYPNVILALSGHNHENEDFRREHVIFAVSKPVVNGYVRLFYVFKNSSIHVRTRNVLHEVFPIGRDDDFWINPPRRKFNFYFDFVRYRSTRSVIGKPPCSITKLGTHTTSKTS